MYINDLTLELEFLQQILTGIIDLICYICMETWFTLDIKQFIYLFIGLIYLWHI